MLVMQVCMHVQYQNQIGKQVQISVQKVIKTTFLIKQTLKMCITLFELFENGPKQKDIEFVIAFNRDQVSSRQAVQFGPFKTDPNIYAGRDVLSGGTWLGLNIKTGVMAWLTNFSRSKSPRFGKSRGDIVLSFLQSNLFEGLNQKQPKQIIEEKLTKLLQTCLQYSPFNLTVYHIRSASIFYICSETGMKTPEYLPLNMVHGICNCQKGVIWPKTQYGIDLFSKFSQNLKKQEEQKQVKFDQIQQSLATIMQNNNQFSDKIQDNSSIFIEPYFNKKYQVGYMTKSTFYCVIRRLSSSQKSIKIREISYADDQNKQVKTINFQTIYNFIPSINNNKMTE